MPKNMSLEEYSKRSKALCDELYKIHGYKEWSFKVKASRSNQITHMVNCQVPKAEADLKDKFEKAYFDHLVKQAELHEQAYGFRPTFEMEEIESDDPVLDRYGPNDTAEKWAAERKKR